MPKIFKSTLNRRLFYYFILLAIYSVFSYSLTAPNLVLSGWMPYWSFQTWMWTTFFNNRPLLTFTFISIILAVLLNFILIIKTWPKNKKINWWLPLLIASPLLLSNNALSYDVFNYIFNAKMVAVYQANPHIQVALSFASDNWTRFMHNTHTPAPYFYGWTGLSLLPYYLGAGKFLPTWLSFRLFSYLSLGLLSFTLTKFNQLKLTKLHIVTLFNPLLLIEIISNAHNDLWMMVPAIISMILISQKKSLKNNLLSLFLLLFSASIKLATLALFPLWLALVLPWKKLNRKLYIFVQKNWAFLASILMFLPLLSPRSKQFLPWYLIWSLVWVTLFNDKWKPWKISLTILSLSSLFRYIPFLWAGNYEGDVIFHQKFITWIPFILFWVIKFTYCKLAKKSC